MESLSLFCGLDEQKHSAVREYDCFLRQRKFAAVLVELSKRVSNIFNVSSRGSYGHWDNGVGRTDRHRQARAGGLFRCGSLLREDCEQGIK